MSRWPKKCNRNRQVVFFTSDQVAGTRVCNIFFFFVFVWLQQANGVRVISYFIHFYLYLFVVRTLQFVGRNIISRDNRQNKILHEHRGIPITAIFIWLSIASASRHLSNCFFIKWAAMVTLAHAILCVLNENDWHGHSNGCFKSYTLVCQMQHFSAILLAMRCIPFHSIWI